MRTPKNSPPAPLSVFKRLYRPRLLFQPVLTDYSTPYCLEAGGGGPLLSSAPLVALVLQVTLFIRLLSQCTAYVRCMYSGCARSRISPFLGNICLSFARLCNFSSMLLSFPVMFSPLLPSLALSSPCKSCILLSF